jgi:hypothetical protein
MGLIAHRRDSSGSDGGFQISFNAVRFGSSFCQNDSFHNEFFQF